MGVILDKILCFSSNDKIFKYFLMKYFGLLFMVLICTSCSKDGQHDSTNVVGEWRWISSIGGIGGWTLTPKTEGFTKKLKFTDRDFLMFKNDTLIESTVYSLNEINDSTRGKFFLLKSSNGLQYELVLQQSKLELIESCYDCYVHFYER